MTKAEAFAMQYGYYDKEKKHICCVGYNAGYKQAKKDLRWHSVKESLPPVGEEVIALCNESHGTTLPIACYMCFAHLVEDKTIFVEYDGWNIPGVKYWMPCPELPEK